MVLHFAVSGQRYIFFARMLPTGMNTSEEGVIDWMVKIQDRTPVNNSTRLPYGTWEVLLSAALLPT